MKIFFKFSDLQLKSIAQIFLDVAQVSLAGFVIEPIVFGKTDFVFVFSGMLLSLFLWCVNLIIMGKVSNDSA